MNAGAARCECRDNAGTCGALALWRVSVGTRRADAQDSCGRHLNMTCAALEGGEGRGGVSLTVRRVAEISGGGSALA